MLEIDDSEKEQGIIVQEIHFRWNTRICQIDDPQINRGALSDGS